MKIKNRLIVLYMAIIIIPFIIILSLSRLYMENLSKRVDREITHVIDSNNVEMIDRLSFMRSTIEEYTLDGKIDDVEDEKLRVLFSRAFKIPLIISINQEEVFRTNFPSEDFNEALFDRVNYTNENSYEISYSYTESVVAARIRKPETIDIFKFYGSISFKVGVLLFIILSLLFIQLISKFFYKPLKSIEGKVNSIKTGEPTEPLEHQRKDEIGDVFLALNDLEEELISSREFQREYEENRNELLANISHDLKTPITAIRAYVDGINDGVANTPEKLKKYISIIGSYIRDMDSLVDDLTLLSNLDIDINSMNFERLNYKEYIEDCAYELDFQMQEHRIDFVYSIDLNNRTMTYMDRDKIKRVINNIISNSLKFNQEDKSKIELRVKEDKDYIITSIRDNGIGIEKEKLDKIFERFYRADESRNSQTGGSGLGLSIARQIVEKHKGQIYARSEPSKYTEIVFKLKKVKI